MLSGAVIIQIKGSETCKDPHSLRHAVAQRLVTVSESMLGPLKPMAVARILCVPIGNWTGMTLVA